MPFLVFRWHVTCCPHRRAFAVQFGDHYFMCIWILDNLMHVRILNEHFVLLDVNVVK